MERRAVCSPISVRKKRGEANRIPAFDLGALNRAAAPRAFRVSRELANQFIRVHAESTLLEGIRFCRSRVRQRRRVVVNVAWDAEHNAPMGRQTVYCQVALVVGMPYIRRVVSSISRQAHSVSALDAAVRIRYVDRHRE